MSTITTSDSVKYWTDYIGKWAEDKGWNEQDRSFGDWISLFHSELSEALEEYRDNWPEGEIYFQGIDNKPCGIPIELADLIIRVLHYCNVKSINLVEAIDLKMQYNENRPFRHGGKLL